MSERHVSRRLRTRLALSMAVAMAATGCVEAAEFGSGGVVPLITIRDALTGTVSTAGSGLLLDADGFVLTAAHLVKDVNPAHETIEVRLFSPNGPPVPAVLKECAQNGADACLLKIDAADVASAHVTGLPDLACRRIEAGEAVTAVGWPGGGLMDLDRPPGIVTGGMPSVGVLYPTSALALHGMSGGPIFDGSGFAVGLVKGGVNIGERVFFTPLFNIRELLSQSPNGCTAKNSSVPPLEVKSATEWSDLPSRFRTWHAVPGDLRSKLASLAAVGDLKISNATLTLPPKGSSRVLSARTLELTDGTIETDGRDLTIEVIDLVSDGGSVRGLHDPSKSGRPALSGGTVKLIVHGQLAGRLDIDLRGQRGADGDAGERGVAGSPGDPGGAGASHLLDCARGPGDGGRGRDGGAGGKGSPGAAGGAGGSLKVYATDVTTAGANLTADVSGGEGGKGGAGGAGGPGGPGGARGSAPGLCQQTASDGPAGGPGPQGAVGEAGLRGPDGSRSIEPLDEH